MSKIKVQRNTLGFILTSPENNEMYVKDLTLFCKNNNLQRWGFYNVLRGTHFTWKGWKIRKTDLCCV